MKLLDNLVRAMDLDIGNSSILDYIREQPAFHDEKKQFDKQKLANTLRQFDISEREYKKELKSDILRNLLVTSLINTPSVPDFLVNKLYNNYYQQRSVDIIKISNDAIQNQHLAPSSKELDKVYEENKDTLLTKEYRNAKYIVMKNTDIKEEVEISDEEIEEDLQSQILNDKEYDLIQLKTPNEETANLIKESLTDDNLDEILEKYKEKNIHKSLLYMKKKSHLPRELRTIDFSMTKVNQIVELDNEPNVIRITKAHEVSVEGIEEFRKEIRDKIKEERLSASLYKSVQKADKEIVVNGFSLEEIAKANDLTIHETGLIDDSGYSSEGKKLDVEKEIFDGLVSSTFNRKLNENDTFLNSSDNLYYNTQVIDVSNKRIMTKDESKGVLEIIWREKNNTYMLKNLADEIVAELKEGTNLNLLKNKYNIEIEEDITLVRPDAVMEVKPDQSYPKEFVESIFKLNGSADKKDVSGIYGGGTQSHLIFGVLKDIKPAPDIEKNKNIFNRYKSQIDEIHKGIILENINKNLRDKFKISINEELMDKISS